MSDDTGPARPADAPPDAGPGTGGPPAAQAPSGGRARRFRSPRRVPAAVTALLVLGGAGLLLYDVAAVRAGRSAMRWRKVVAGELARRPLDDTWIITGAAVATALGLWLLLLALTPGLRQVLALRRGPGRDRPGPRRDAAGLLLRDRTLEVPGVQSVRVAVGRRRARVRAASHFRELDDVTRDVHAVLDDAGRGLGLDRPLRTKVRVRRARKG